MSASFLPADYQAPAASGGQYTKFAKGETRIRITSSPIIGWLYWNLDGKPVRLREKPQGKPEDMRLVSANGQPEKIKHFWAVKCYNYTNAQMEVLEITQATIQAALQTLSEDGDWGHPKQYDLKVLKKGDGLNTEYTVTPAPRSTPSAEVVEAFNATPIDLDALFAGENPFGASPALAQATQATQAMTAPKPANAAPKPVPQMKPKPAAAPVAAPQSDDELPF